MSTKIVCVFNKPEIFDKVVKNNKNLKNCDIWGYDNTKDNVAVTKYYNDFIEKNISMTSDFWCLFIHQDFGIMEDIDLLVRKLNRKHIYGAVGNKTYRGFFFGQKDKYKPFGIKSRFGISFRSMKLWGMILQGNNDDNFITIGQKAFFSKTVDAIDCCCIMLHSSMIEKYKLRFDENLNFHMYVEELCYNAKKNYKIKIKVVQMKCFHMGRGSYDEEFIKSAQYLKDKFHIKRVPSTCPN